MDFEKDKNEERVKKISWAVGIIITAFVIFLVIVGFHIGFGNNNNDAFVGLCTLFTGILAITGVCFTIYFNQKIKDKELYEAQKLKNQELLNELDQKSEWRKELMDIAAKPVMQLEDVYRIFASLRFLPKSKVEIEGEESEQQEEQESKREQQEKQDVRQSNEEGKKEEKDKDNRKGGSDQKEFDVISNYIYKRLNTMLNSSLDNFSVDETLTDEALKRTFTIRKSEEIRLYTKFLLKHHWEYNQSEKDKEDFKDKELKEFKKVMKEIHRLNQEDNIKKDYYKIDEIYAGILDDYAKELEANSEDKKINIIGRLEVSLFYLN